MELLQEADFCIADLTYARPSVYFEAGFAGATKPVVYIARRDHFRARDNDPAGNQRVHFDLQMKNIIPWGGSSSEFRKKLSRRVKLVTGPLTRKLILATERSIEREAFLALSERQRIEALERLADKAVTQHAFKTISKSSFWHRMLGFSSVLDAGKTYRDTDVLLRVYVEPQFRLKDLQSVAFRKAFSSERNGDHPKPAKKRLLVVSIFATPSKMSASLLDRGFPHHSRMNGCDIRHSARHDSDRKTLVRSIVIPLQQVASLRDFERQLNEALALACSNAMRQFTAADL
jgi:hypothetical protein